MFGRFANCPFIFPILGILPGCKEFGNGLIGPCCCCCCCCWGSSEGLLRSGRRFPGPPLRSGAKEPTEPELCCCCGGGGGGGGGGGEGSNDGGVIEEPIVWDLPGGGAEPKISENAASL